MSRAALQKNEDFYAEKIDPVDWWGDFDMDVPPKKPKLRVYENTQYGRQPSRGDQYDRRPYRAPVRQKKTSHSAMAFVAAFLFFMLATFQISRIALLNEKGKEIARLKSEIKALQQDNESKEVRLTFQENIDRVRDVAINDFGMVVPTDEQTIVFNANTEQTGANAEMAEAAGEEMEAYIAP